MREEQEVRQVLTCEIRVAERQRKDYGDIESLKASMKSIGQLQPIIILDDDNKNYYELLAGGRRLQAAIELGWIQIECKIYYREMSDTDKVLIEIEENIKRKQLDWREEVLAAVQLHDAHCKINEKWNVSNTADVLNISGRWASRYLSVGRALQQGDEKVNACQSIAAAAAAISRKMQRDVDDEAVIFFDNSNVTIGRNYKDTISEVIQSDQEFKSIRSAEHDVHCADFVEWADKYSGSAFQVIHLDPPYGIMHHESEQGGGSVHGTYSDTEDDLWRILEALDINKDRIVAPRAHIVFWFSFKFYSQIIDFFSHSNWDDTTVNNFPLVWWKRDNIGLVPDAKRYGRRVYETALLISVGDRQINTVRPNLFAWESGKARAKHLSEKPEPVVNYFLSILIEPERCVNFLDPCCGSGSSLSAAERLGAINVTGLDIDPDTVTIARRTLNARRLREVGRGTEIEEMSDNQLDSVGE